MDLRQLEYVVAVADTGGFTAGAVAAHVAQPSLSARVRDLERELGVELFHRLARGVRLSSAGEMVVDHARQVLADVAALRAAASEVAGVEAGSLDLAALPTLSVDPLAALVGRFRKAHPAIVVRVAETDDAGTEGGVAGLVRSGRVEVGLTELLGAPSELVTVVLADQELVAIAAAGTAVPRRRALGAHPLVLTPPGTSSRRVVDAAYAAAGLVPNVAVEVAQREAIVPLVLAGAGIGFVPGAQAEAARAQGAVSWRPDPPLVRRIGLVQRPGRASPAARAFVAMAAAAADRRQPKRPVM